SRRADALRRVSPRSQHQPQVYRWLLLASTALYGSAEPSRRRAALLQHGGALRLFARMAARLLHHADLQPSALRPARASALSATGLPAQRTDRRRRRKRSRCQHLLGTTERALYTPLNANFNRRQTQHRVPRGARPDHRTLGRRRLVLARPPSLSS